MMHPVIFSLDITTIVLFVLTIIKQFRLQHHYKNLNGLKYHRLAYMAITISTTFALIANVIHQLMDGYIAIDFEPTCSIILILFTKVFMFVVSIFSFMWFMNFKFKFLKIFDKLI